MSLIFVDCEAHGPCPGPLGTLTEFGAVTYPRRESFHGLIYRTRPSAENPAVPEPGGALVKPAKEVFLDFDVWLHGVTHFSKTRPVFVSDNPAYDWQWINHGFWTYLGRNPFGHSARRISDFYAGLTNNFSNTQKWKRLRVTPHDHNPVHDALGNVEAFERMLKGER